MIPYLFKKTNENFLRAAKLRGTRALTYYHRPLSLKLSIMEVASSLGVTKKVGVLSLSSVASQEVMYVPGNGMQPFCSHLVSEFKG